MRLFQKANRQIRADGRDAEKLLAKGYVEICPAVAEPKTTKKKATKKKAE